LQIAAEGLPAIAFRPTGATKLLRDLPAPVQESVASVPNSLTSGWEAQGSLPRGELPLEQDLIDCRCLLISRTCSLLPVCAGTRPRTRTHTEPPLLPQSAKHSLGDGSRTTSRYATLDGPTSYLSLCSSPSRSHHARHRDIESAHALEQRLRLPLAHRAGRRPALGKPGARSAEREDACRFSTSHARGTRSTGNLRSRTPRDH